MPASGEIGDIDQIMKISPTHVFQEKLRQKEEELQEKAEKLEETNIALKVLLEHRSRDRQKLESRTA